ESVLGCERDRIDRLAVMPDGDQLRRRGGIGVPEIVMNGLEMPEPLSRPRIEREQTIRVEIIAVPIAAIELVLGRSGRHVHRPPLHVHGDFAPHIDAAHVFVGVLGPGFISVLAWARDRVEYPDELAREDIESANIARWGEVTFAGRAAKDDQVFEDASRG